MVEWQAIPPRFSHCSVTSTWRTEGRLSTRYMVVVKHGGWTAALMTIRLLCLAQAATTRAQGGHKIAEYAIPILTTGVHTHLIATPQ